MPESSRSWATQSAPRAVALFAAMFLVAYACLLMPRAAGQLTPIWLPNAFLVAAMATGSPRRWPLSILMGSAGILAAHFATGSSTLRAVGLTICNGLEVYLAAVLIFRRFGTRPEISRVRTVIEYDAVVAIPAVAGAGLASLFLWQAFGAPIAPNFFTWSMAEWVGLVTITPSAIVLASEWRNRRRFDVRRAWPLLLLIAITAIGFSQPYPFTYLIAGALLLVAYRLELAGAAIGVCVVLLIAVSVTVLGEGPFVTLPGTLAQRMLALQVFLAAAYHMSVPVAFYRQRERALQGRVDAALRDAQVAEAKYREIAEAIPDIIVQTDPQGMILYASPSVRFLGWTPADLVGRSGLEFVHPEDNQDLLTMRSEFFDGAQATVGPTSIQRFRTREGEYRWLEGRRSVIRNEGGQQVAVETVFRDVTEARAAEQALKASEASYRLISENISDIVACYGLDGVIRYLSPSVQAALGYAPEELIGRRIATLLDPDDAQRVAAEFAAHRDRSDHETFRVEYRMFRKDGSVGWFEAHPRPIYDARTGAFVEWQDVVRDIGERKALEAELRAAKQAAEAASDAKSEFLANMSHELRTPLTGVLGFTKLANEVGGLAEPARTYVQRVDEASTALLALVNDVLDYSKLEAGDVKFRFAPVAVSGVVRSCVNLFEAQALDKGIIVDVEDHVPTGILLELDPDRLRQVLINLIGNAVKFTDVGAVTVRLRYDRGRRELGVEVQDTGPGVAPERQAEVFERFTQAHDGERQYGGAGLGLAICKAIVEALGGRIGVTSQVGEGSCFAFSVPCRIAKANARVARRAQREMACVLVADDHADVRDLVALFLKDTADVTVVADGRAAVKAASLKRFDVMFLDVRMPVLDGAQALKRIRAGRGPNRATPALAFTADPAVPTADRLRKQGFAGVVVKPISSVELVSLVAEAVATQRLEQSAA
jgi:PAS domain S-box-containing protein